MKRTQKYRAKSQTKSQLSILVKSGIVGKIIGRGGSTIKEIKEKTHTR